MGFALLNAKNLLMRPKGGWKGIPKYLRLWAIGASQTVEDTYRGLPFTDYPSGIGADDTARQANKTCAIRIYRQGKNFLFFFDLVNSKARGLFYLGDDGSYPSGGYSFMDGPPSYEVLAVGLDSDARWYGTQAFTEILLGNGVDDNAIVQLNRTATPGRWRKAASNVKPAAPRISLVQPQGSTNVQAKWTIPGAGGTPPARSGPASMTFTAKSSNFPGASGNNRIRLRIVNNPASSGISSTLDGEGTTAEPYYYTVTTGTSAGSSSNTALVSYINGDSRVLSILSAATSAPDATVDLGDYGPTDLSGGTGTGTSEGFTNRTVKVYARYWDPGQEDLGYEGISSDASNELVIPANANNDISVRISVDPDAEGGRFGFIRLYMQIGEAPAEDYLLVDPENPVPNQLSSSVFVADAGTNFLYSVTGASRLTGNLVPAQDLFTISGPFMANNTPIVFPTPASGNLYSGLTAGTVYYTRQINGNDYKVLSSPNGTVVNVGDAGTLNLVCYVLTPNLLRVGDTTEVSSTGTLPAPLSAGTTYYCRDTDTYRTKLALTLSGNAIDLTTVGSGTHTFLQLGKTVQIGTNTPILSVADGGSMSADQNRPLPHKYHAMVGTRVWRAGTTDYPLRLQPSRDATSDQLVPEGANAESYEEVQINNSQPGNNRITGMHSDGAKLHIHNPAGVIILTEPNINPATRFDPPVLAGALNGSCIVPWEKNSIFYFGTDLRVVEQKDDSLYQRLQAESVDDATQQYLRSRVDLTVLGRNPERAFMFADTSAKMLWYFLPALDGTLKGFAYDFVLKGITGEFDYPKVYASAHMEKDRPEMIFTDEEGNLFVWDTSAQNDTGNAFSVSAPFVQYSIEEPLLSQFNGYGYLERDGIRYYQAYETVMQTGFIDLGSPDRRKAFMSLLFRTVQNSRAIVQVKLVGLDGQEAVFEYGDVADFGVNHRAHVMLGDSAISVVLTVFSADQKPWIMRDMSILSQLQGPA